MNGDRSSRPFATMPMLVAAAVALGCLTLPRTVLAQAAVTSRGVEQAAEPGRSIVRLGSVRLESPSVAAPSIIVYADGPARAATGSDPLRPLADTLRLDRLPALTLDVTDADVHIRLLSPGTIAVEGPVTGPGSANRLGAGGRHIVFVKGGSEVRVLEGGR